MGFGNFLSKIFGNKAQRDRELIQPYIDKIELVYPSIKALSNDELRERTEEIKQRIQDYVSAETKEIADLKSQIESQEIEQREKTYAQIDKLSKEGNPDAIAFPRAKVAENEYDFSFSGLKSAVLNYLNGCQMKGEEYNQADVAASFQKAVVDVLVEHSLHAVETYGLKKFAIAGGVASNSSLRKAFEEECEKRQIEFYHPSPVYCTDNAAMIGVAAYYEYIKGTRHGWDLNAVPNLKLGERI